MKEEEKYMVKFLQEEKVELARLEEERLKAEEEGGEEQQENADWYLSPMKLEG